MEMLRLYLFPYSNNHFRLCSCLHKLMIRTFKRLASNEMHSLKFRRDWLNFDKNIGMNKKIYCRQAILESKGWYKNRSITLLEKVFLSFCFNLLIDLAIDQSMPFITYSWWKNPSEEFYQGLCSISDYRLMHTFILSAVVPIIWILGQATIERKIFIWHLAPSRTDIIASLGHPMSSISFVFVCLSDSLIFRKKRRKTLVWMNQLWS